MKKGDAINTENLEINDLFYYGYHLSHTLWRVVGVCDNGVLARDLRWMIPEEILVLNDEDIYYAGTMGRMRKFLLTKLVMHY